MLLTQTSEGEQTQPQTHSSESEGYRICNRCVMDTTDPDISFDDDGVCNHCHEYDYKAQIRLFSEVEGQQRLDEIVEKIKASGRNKDYDCIVGVSGGVDSTYVAYKAKQLGLRPLAVHFDNGWNSELAVSNIEKILNNLKIDLDTYVVDWEEFRDLQLSFLKASVPDCEVPTDHGIYALLMQTAVKHGIKYVLNGMNFRTEAGFVPAWAYGHSDWKYIRSIHKIFGSKPLKTFPRFSYSYLFYALMLRRVKFIAILNYLPYDKSKTAQLLESELGWRPYGGKHHESIYTKFLQSYILPKKFGYDKRKIFLSSLILSQQGGMTRELALEELKKDPADPRELEQDREFVIKKFELTPDEFDALLGAPPKTFRDYPSSYGMFTKLRKLQLYLRKIGVLSS